MANGCGFFLKTHDHQAGGLEANVPRQPLPKLSAPGQPKSKPTLKRLLLKTSPPSIDPYRGLSEAMGSPRHNDVAAVGGGVEGVQAEAHLQAAFGGLRQGAGGAWAGGVIAPRNVPPNNAMK